MTRAQVIRALHAPGIRTDIAWAVKKKRTNLTSAMATGAQLALPRSGGRPSASGTLAGSSHNEEPRCQSSDARQEQFKFFYNRKRKFYSRRKFQQPCVREAAGAVVAHASSIVPEYDGEVNCDDGQDTSTIVATTTVVEKSEESAPSSASPKAWEGRRSTTRMKRNVPSSPPVLAGVAGVTMRQEDGTDGKQPEAQAAAATADVGRPQRRRKPRVSKYFVNTSTPSYEWLTYYPGVPFPEDYEQLDNMEQLGEVETISTGSEGVSADISDSADKPFSLKLQTEIQKTSKARRILVEDAALFHSVPGQVEPQHAPPAAAAAAANPPTLPKEASSPMCSQTPDKLQESNGECELGNRTSATPSESAAAAAATDDDDKDGSWNASA